MPNKLHNFTKYIMIIFMSISTSACVTGSKYMFWHGKDASEVVQVPKEVQKHYAAVTEGKFSLPAIDMSTIDKKYWRKSVDFPTKYPVGTILVDTEQRLLYLIRPKGKAVRYGVGVGREGLALTGTTTIGAKIKWPHWSPTKDMMVRDPDIYGNMQKGLEPGVDNPLGARALYLFKDGKDSHFRIHGSHESWSIGKAMSSGCIMMLNQDVIDLYKHVSVGTKVIILNHDRSEIDADKPSLNNDETHQKFIKAVDIKT